MGIDKCFYQLGQHSSVTLIFILLLIEENWLLFIFFLRKGNSFKLQDAAKKYINIKILREMVIRKYNPTKAKVLESVFLDFIDSTKTKKKKLCLNSFVSVQSSNFVTFSIWHPLTRIEKTVIVLDCLFSTMSWSLALAILWIPFIFRLSFDNFNNTIKVSFCLLCKLLITVTWNWLGNKFLNRYNGHLSGKMFCFL